MLTNAAANFAPDASSHDHAIAAADGGAFAAPHFVAVDAAVVVAVIDSIRGAVVSADFESNFAAVVISYGGAHVKAHGSADPRADGAAFPVPLWSADATSNGLTDE